MSDEEQQNDEGFMPRELTVRIDEVVWSNPKASSSPPTVGATMLRHAGGWTVHDGERTPWVDPDRPMLQPGHSYLEAVFKETRGPDGTEIPPSWKGLGEGSKLPYDDGVIGNGETEGRAVAPAKYRTIEDEPGPATLEEQLAGKSATALATALDAAAPGTSSP
ncbi:hypothetical protein [Streptomyces cucumeris]|uniref:hypothetical protein n=1 Tax=Streptomyces cucumeris TaxID=2962890 RepID=UPI003D7146CF